MTGPEHYREAERLIAVAIEAGIDGDREAAAHLAQIGQVHATLALADATVRTHPTASGITLAEWRESVQ